MRLQHIAAMLVALVVSIGACHSSPARTLTWPDGCAYTAHYPSEHPLPDACAEAIDALDWSALPRGEDGGPYCDLDYSKGLHRVRELEDRGSYYIQFEPLGRGRFLMRLLCVSGAYNAQYIYVLYDEAQRPVHAEFLWFPSYRMREQLPAKEVTPYVFARSFNPKTRELVALAKYRGMGDCGEFWRFVLRGSAFVLTEYRAKTECDGTAIYQLREGVTQTSPHWKRYYPR